MSTQELSFGDLNVGDQWSSRSRTVTEADIVNFACMTGDFDPLHVDHEHARQTPFGRPIAHGLLGLAWIAGLGSNYPQVRTAAFVEIRQWRFHKPVYVGDTLSVRNTVESLAPSGRKRGRVIWKRELLNQNNEVVQSGLLETLVWL